MTTRYNDVHAWANLKGPGDARPTALQIVEDNGLVGKLTGKVALVTGVSSGIGIDTARAMKASGMRVFGGVRDIQKGTEALKDDLEPGKLELVRLDLNSLDSVRACAEEIKSKTSTLNILINNAGIMMTPEGRTADGHELQFGTNHLAHFLLFQILKPLLLSSATPTLASRVVSVSSAAHRNSVIHFDNLTLSGEYEPSEAYGQSKLANVYFANEIERRYSSQNLHAWSLMPGGIWTGLQQYLPAGTMEMWRNTPDVNKFMKSTAQGAATSVLAALDKELEGKGGKYLDDCQVSKQARKGASLAEPGHAENAFDVEAAKKLWEVSCEIVGVQDDE